MPCSMYFSETDVRSTSLTSFAFGDLVLVLPRGSSFTHANLVIGETGRVPDGVVNREELALLLALLPSHPSCSNFKQSRHMLQDGKPVCMPGSDIKHRLSRRKCWYQFANNFNNNTLSMRNNGLPDQISNSGLSRRLLQLLEPLSRSTRVS